MKQGNGAVVTVAVGTPPVAPEYLWLLEAVVRLRLETGCSHEFAVTEFQALYPTINVQMTLERTVAQLMRIMQPYYDQRVASGWVPSIGKNGRKADAAD